MFNRGFVGGLYVICALFTGQACAGGQSDFAIDDVERFAQMLASQTPITAQLIERSYLTPGSLGQTILAQRIGGSRTLANTVNQQPEIYQRAISMCLPAVRSLRAKVLERIRRVTSYVGQPQLLPVSITIAANNTAATVNNQGIALALEVICQQANEPRDVEQLVLDYVGHEAVHVLQYRNSQRTEFRFTLLELALIEGSADFIAASATGHSSQLQTVRERYGDKHAHQLWTRFFPLMDTFQYAPWLYSPTAGEQPADMGYWIGQQIAKAYFQNSDDKRQALDDLIRLKDAKAILKHSGIAQHVGFDEDIE
ncbi:DUF2268 domain-containing protein [Aestuariibacter halophilus]|uniref:DUF2268 domain-containing protein n=1 Tax=Fluctibacter halophilus TaxID=226011 RepID=A0ABS8G2C9_9ALTE|nr:DUF2268 domain-containing putative Zn-dependent protease [Aestuariibacter halophilus]MCC2614737.1 DUF2268 domain-containing protein [Aestuariibacter halophilus]